MRFRTADRGKLPVIKKDAVAVSERTKLILVRGNPQCCACGFDSEVALKMQFPLGKTGKGLSRSRSSVLTLAPRVVLE